jgi:hypothetical protein
MAEAYSKSQDNLVRGESLTYNNLLSKIVLLIGNDAAALHVLAAAFAARGSDIVLLSSQLSVDITNAIRESVLALGRGFLLLDKSLSNGQNAELVVSKVKKEMGGIDILVDISARDEGMASKTKRDKSQPIWWLSKAMLQEIRNKNKGD